MSDVMHRQSQGTNVNDEQQLQALEQERAAAELSGGAAFFESALAEDFVGVGPLGFMLSKKDWIDRYASGDLKHQSFEWGDAQIRLYGDAAVVIGRETTK